MSIGKRPSVGDRIVEAAIVATGSTAGRQVEAWETNVCEKAGASDSLRRLLYTLFQRKWHSSHHAASL